MMVKNEDVWIGQAIRNIQRFADEILVIDTGSSDGTIQIAGEMGAQVIFEPEMRRTHRCIDRYLHGFKGWVFGVDGDELYDPVGLQRVKGDMKAGFLQGAFQIETCYLHALTIDCSVARGYLGPPSRTPSKLYNFSKLIAWPSDDRHILFQARTRRIVRCTPREPCYQDLGWDKSPFRCLHTRFLRRSTLEPKATVGVRLHGEDLLGFGDAKDRGGVKGQNARRCYRLGAVVKTDVSRFLVGEGVW